MISKLVLVAGCVLATAGAALAQQATEQDEMVPVDGRWSRTSGIVDKGAKNLFIDVPDGDIVIPPARQNCINFDNLSAPCTFLSTRALRNEYVGLGVMFDGPGAFDGGAAIDECGDFDVNARSTPAYLAFNDSAWYTDGGIAREPETIRFTSPVSRVTMWISGGKNINTVVIRAYDAGGSVIDSDTVNAPSGRFTEARVSANGIVRVVVDDAGDGIFVIDDLCWEFSTNGCLNLEVSNLIAGQFATWTVSNLPPGVRAAVVWGFSSGQTVVGGAFGYCATFDIQGVNANRLIGQPSANGSGVASISKRVPGSVSGVRLLMQAAQHGTCPGECVSNLLEETIG